MFSDFICPFLFWLYVAVTLIQIVAWWGIFRGLYTLNPQSPIPHPHLPTTIIICARNEADNLRRHLPKILDQQYAGTWEVIVVDDASEDETPTVLQFFQEKYSRLQVVQVVEKRHPGKKHALAQGIAAAKFANLLLTDADCEPASPFWLAHMTSVLSQNPKTEIVLGYGPIVPAPGFLNGWIRFETAHTAMLYFSAARAGIPYMGVGRNLAFKKQAYERVGGFTAHADVLSGDDDLLVNAAATADNVATCLHPESFMFSEGKRTWQDWARQRRRHLVAGKRYRLLHQALLTVLSLSHTLHFFLLAVLLPVGVGTVSVGLIYLARSFSMLYLYGKILPQLREFHLLSRIPIYDTLLAAYYGAFVPLSLIAPRSACSAWK